MAVEGRVTHLHSAGLIRLTLLYGYCMHMRTEGAVLAVYSSKAYRYFGGWETGLVEQSSTWFTAGRLIMMRMSNALLRL